MNLKSCSSRKINNIGEHLARLPRKEEKRYILPISGMREVACYRGYKY